jgi:hypothetical protein
VVTTSVGLRMLAVLERQVSADVPEGEVVERIQVERIQALPPEEPDPDGVEPPAPY